MRGQRHLLGRILPMSIDVAKDGSPVAIYDALPAESELGVVRRYAEGQASVLDLGCGTSDSRPVGGRWPRSRGG